MVDPVREDPVTFDDDLIDGKWIVSYNACCTLPYRLRLDRRYLAADRGWMRPRAGCVVLPYPVPDARGRV